MKTLSNTMMNNHTNQHYSTGLVTRKTSGCYSVTWEEQEVNCTLGAGLRRQDGARGQAAHSRTDPVAVGDLVRFQVVAGGGLGQIVEVLPRRNKLSRRSAVPMPTATPYEQVIVTNIDQVVPVFAAANPAPKWGLLDRYLALAEAQDLAALVVITKLDLVRDADGGLDPEIQATVDEYRRIGYPVLLTSAVTGEGLADLQQALQGKCSVLLGKSGVGKSALLNALQPGLGQRVGAVSQVTGKGKHTTTHQEMFPLAFGGSLVDTPGMREFGLWDVDGSDLALYYREMRPFLGRCRFGMGCTHQEEPGCAIRKAVNEGLISPQRYLSYLSLKQG